MKNIIIALVLISMALSASEQTVFGTVSDTKGIPLQGANTYIDGTLDGAVSDANGSFSFKTTINNEEQADEIAEQLVNIPGVIEATLVHNESVAYLKLDEKVANLQEIKALLNQAI